MASDFSEEHCRRIEEIVVVGGKLLVESVGQFLYPLQFFFHLVPGLHEITVQAFYFVEVPMPLAQGVGEFVAAVFLKVFTDSDDLVEGFKLRLDVGVVVGVFNFCQVDTKIHNRCSNVVTKN